MAKPAKNDSFRFIEMPIKHTSISLKNKYDKIFTNVKCVDINNSGVDTFLATSSPNIFWREKWKYLAFIWPSKSNKTQKCKCDLLTPSMTWDTSQSWKYIEFNAEIMMGFVEDPNCTSAEVTLRAYKALISNWAEGADDGGCGSNGDENSDSTTMAAAAKTTTTATTITTTVSRRCRCRPKNKGKQREKDGNNAKTVRNALKTVRKSPKDNVWKYVVFYIENWGRERAKKGEKEKNVEIVDLRLIKSFTTRLWSQTSASIQPRRDRFEFEIGEIVSSLRWRISSSRWRIEFVTT